MAPAPRQFSRKGGRDTMRVEVVAGLGGFPKKIPSKYFYDETGSRLFELICRTPEYYLTRTERQLLGGVATEVARLAGRGRVVIEPGSGSCEKFGLIAEALRPVAYVPVEICAEALDEAVARLGRQYPWLSLVPRHGDFLEKAPEHLPWGRRLVFFPGSTIGNFDPDEAVAFLQGLSRLAGRDGALLIGVDLKKDPAVLHAAYNDRAGMTAAFNLNLLARLNRELDAEFDLGAFEHRAFFNAEAGRVEMHLVSRREQRVRIGRCVIQLAAGETIHTENSHKYTIDEFRALAMKGGWCPGAAWTDPERLFSVHYMVVGGGQD